MLTLASAETIVFLTPFLKVSSTACSCLRLHFGLMVSENQWWVFPLLIFQGLFLDCLRARICLDLFGILWHQEWFMYSDFVYLVKLDCYCLDNILWQLALALYSVFIQGIFLYYVKCCLWTIIMFSCPWYSGKGMNGQLTGVEHWMPFVLVFLDVVWCSWWPIVVLIYENY